MKKEGEEVKEIRLNIRFPASVVNRIDEDIRRGNGETRSGYVRSVVFRHFENADDTRLAIMRLLGPMTHPVAGTLGALLLGEFADLVSCLTAGGPDQQREAFEKQLPKVSELVSQMAGADIESVRDYLESSYAAYESREAVATATHKLFEIAREYPSLDDTIRWVLDWLSGLVQQLQKETADEETAKETTTASAKRER